MKLSGAIKFNIYIFLGLHILIAYCCIWVFMRMVPVIAKVTTDNENSIRASMSMMAIMADYQAGVMDKDVTIDQFEHFLNIAENIITEENEEEQLIIIRSRYKKAFAGDKASFYNVTRAISRIEEINRYSVHESMVRAQHMGYAGAWGIVFLASVNFIIGLFFVRNMRVNLVEPIEEMGRTMRDFKNGNTIRRCQMLEQCRGKSMEKLLKNLNEILDASCGLR